MAKLKVLIADHMEIYREGLKYMLEQYPDITVAGICSTGEEAVAATRKLRPDVLLLAEGIPKPGFLEVTQRIREIKPHPRVIIFTQSRQETHDPFYVFRSQASGYVDRETGAGNLVSIINRVIEGDFFVSPLQGRMLVQEMNHLKMGSEENRRTRLSERETEIVSLVAQGMTNRDIARQLFITENTVKSHVSRIMQKLEVKNRHQMAMIAVEKSLVMKGKS